jgi:hypothetical protein
VSAFDDQVQNSLNRTFDALRAHVESGLASCRDELARLTAEEGTRLAKETAEAAEAATAAAKHDVERQLNEWRETAAHDAEERERDVEARVRQAEAREQDAEAREHDAETRRTEAEARLQASEKVAHELRRSLDEVQQQGQREIDAAREDVELARQQLSQRVLEIDSFQQQIRGFDDALADAARLLDAIKRLDQAASLGDALDGLVQFAGREAGRAAVFLMKGMHLHDWRAVGFNGASLDVDIDETGPFSDALRGVRGACRGDALPGFAKDAERRYGVTMPIVVGGAIVAVLYADAPEADNEDEPLWPDRLDVIVRYAGRMLESITIRQAAGLSGGPPVKLGSPASITSRSPGSIQ